MESFRGSVFQAVLAGAGASRAQAGDSYPKACCNI